MFCQAKNSPDHSRKKEKDLWVFGLWFHTSGDFSVERTMTFIFQISAHTTIQSHVVISVFGSEHRIIADNLFKRECNMKSKHAKRRLEKYLI